MNQIQLYDTVNRLSIEMPELIREDIKSDLLFMGLQMIKDNKNSIYTRLYYRRFHVYAMYKKRVEMEKYAKEWHELREEQEQKCMKLSYLYGAYIKLDGPAKKLLFTLIDMAGNCEFKSLSDSIRRFGVSKKRGFLIMRKIREAILNAEKEHELQDLSGIRELQEKVSKCI